MQQVAEQVSRQPQPLPTLKMPEFSTIGELINTGVADYELLDYQPMESIKAPMAV
jgi:thymidylate synthase